MNQSDGETPAFYYSPPAELPDGYLEAIINLVMEVGSVGTKKWVRQNLENAFLIGYVLDKGKIIACSSLKHPRPEYIRTVREQAGLNLEGFLERGYTSVLPEYRGKGLASKLLAGLTSKIGDKKLYSAVGEDNIGGQKIAVNNRTRKVAVYESAQSGKKIGIWMPEWMIEGDAE
ncbi:MAG: GNAT family N-acetyltransferase [Thermodesulfobacteriota bacterium]